MSAQGEHAPHNPDTYDDERSRHGPGVGWDDASPADSARRHWLEAWRWPIGYALLVAVILEVPYRLAASQGAAGAAFVGMFWAPHDVAQYHSAMRQGATSDGWLILDRFSQEPHGPVLMYALYVALGKLAGLLGASVEQLFLAAGAVGRVFLLLAVYAFTALATPTLRTRRLALVVISLSTGLASVIGVLQLLTGLPLPMTSRELNDPELNTFLVLFTAPHLMIGLGLLLIAARLYAGCWTAFAPAELVVHHTATITANRAWVFEAARAIRADQYVHPTAPLTWEDDDEPPAAPRHVEPASNGPGSVRWRMLGLTATVLALGFINPFPLVPLCIVVGAHALVMATMQRRIDWGGWLGAVMVGASAAPFLLYSVVAFTFDPFWGATYGRQNVTLTPVLEDMLPAVGLILPLAVVGIVAFARALSPGRVLVLVWLVLALILMYLPTGIQRRFGIGLHPLLALLATFGVALAWDALRRMRRPFTLLRPLASAGLIQALFGSSAYMYVVAWTIALAPTVGWRTFEAGPGADRAPYQQASVRAAADWLAAALGPDDVVLASTLTGNYLAGIVPGRAYVGHWVATLDFGEKKKLAEWFYSGALDADRRAYLDAASIDYVVIGPAERILGSRITADRQLHPVYENGEVVVYRVEPGQAAARAP